MLISAPGLFLSFAPQLRGRNALDALVIQQAACLCRLLQGFASPGERTTSSSSKKIDCSTFAAVLSPCASTSPLRATWIVLMRVRSERVSSLQPA